MRPVLKHGSGPYPLTLSHTSPPLTHEDATRRWSRFSHKPDVLNCLLEEQYGLCCYSEIRPDLIGLGFHIEHVENKGKNPGRTFDYTNLAASALNSRHDLKALSTQKGDIFGGHVQDDIQQRLVTRGGYR
jgi:uncharacterized protein (TIGR02646 family)